MSSTPCIELAGTGLHSGRDARVRLRRAGGPVTLEANGARAAIANLRSIGTVRALTVAPNDGGFRVRTVDHLFAALAGLGIYDGLAIEVDGDELPILDGGAASFCRALRTVREPHAQADRIGDNAQDHERRRRPSRLRVVRRATIEVRGSRYEFTPETGFGETALHVEVDFNDARLNLRARWFGDADDFVERIAPARTFAFEAELPALLARGLAQHVAPESVVVLTRDRVLCSGRPFSADEPVRHKLLDLAGDLYLYGGPPIGAVHAFRPGHGATHAAMAEAFATGVIAAAS